jgi:hypothetical protein
MRRKLFFRDFEVLRSKRTHGGAQLPPDRILVKLRKSGKQPFWMNLEENEFRRLRFFRTQRTTRRV